MNDLCPDGNILQPNPGARVSLRMYLFGRASASAITCFVSFMLTMTSLSGLSRILGFERDETGLEPPISRTSNT